MQMQTQHSGNYLSICRTICIYALSMRDAGWYDVSCFTLISYLLYSVYCLHLFRDIFSIDWFRMG